MHAATYSSNFPGTSVVCHDASVCSAETLREAAQVGAFAHGRPRDEAFRIDVVFGAPPCQGFSHGGLRDGADPRNSLVMHFARLAIALRPRYVVMENVPGWIARRDERGRPWLDRLSAALRRAGYRVAAPMTLNAQEFGVPQDRRRIIVVATCRDANPVSPPTPITSVQPRRRSHVLSATHDDLPACPRVIDAIGDLPDVDAFAGLLAADELRLTPAQWALMCGQASKYARLYIGLDPSPDDLSQPRARSPLLLTSCRRTQHTAATQARFDQLPAGAADAVSRLIRLRADGVATTLRAGSGYERGSFSAPRPIHPHRPRVITVREAARLHGYPDWFRFHTTKWHGFRQVGNSVPPPMGFAMARRIVLALGAVPARRQALLVGDPRLTRLTTSEAVRALGLDPADERRPSHRLRTRRSR